MFASAYERERLRALTSAYGRSRALASAYERYCQFDATRREELVAFLLEAEHYDEAARQLVVMLDDPQATDDARRVKKVWGQLMELARKSGGQAP